MTRFLVGASMILGIGCEIQPVTLQTETLEFVDDVPVGTLVLEDVDSAQVETDLDVEEIELAAGEDVLLDWSGLSVDLWGRPLDPVLEARRATLYHFTIDELDLLLDGLVHNELPQSVVDLQVTCESETASCRLSDFTFMLGHELDVVERFVEGDGTWLLAVQSNDGREDLAYLVLVPVESSTSVLAEVTDDSSFKTVETDLRNLPVVEVRDDGEMLVDWAGLTTDCEGEPLDPRLIDRVVVARVDDATLDDPDLVLLQLPEVALELWVAQVPNSASSFSLARLVDPENGQQGFQGPVGRDPWLLVLSCSTCGDALPRFVTRLAWAEAQ